MQLHGSDGKFILAPVTQQSQKTSNVARICVAPIEFKQLTITGVLLQSLTHALGKRGILCLWHLDVLCHVLASSKGGTEFLNAVLVIVRVLGQVFVILDQVRHSIDKSRHILVPLLVEAHGSQLGFQLGDGHP